MKLCEILVQSLSKWESIESSMFYVEGRKALCTLISTGESRNTKRTAHLFSGMRCGAVLREMPGMT